MKFIIENRTEDLTDVDCMLLVTEVVKHGRISNFGKQYCYLTSIMIDKGEYYISTDLNKKSDRFLITKRVNANP